MRKPERPYIIDVEASGFGPHSYPIEVGVVLEAGTSWCSLIAPEPDWTFWDPAAEAVHHVPREVLLARGRPAAQVAQHLNELLAGVTVYTDGWVVDQPWLIQLFARAGLAQRFAVSALEMILTEPQMAVWHRVKDETVRALALTRHRASSDALIVQETWLRSRQFALAA